MASIKGVIFDMDGVIVDTAGHHFRAWRTVVNKLGFDIDESFDEKLKGVGRMVCLDLILEHGKMKKTDAEKIAIADEKNNLFLEYISQINESDILPGVAAFLDDLDRNKIPFALGSASKNAPQILKQTGLAHRFKAVVDGNSISKPKPNPEVFLKGAEKLGLDSKFCVVFEDAFNGVEAAKNGGFYCVGVGPESILGKADFCIDTFEGLNFNSLLNKLP